MKFSDFVSRESVQADLPPDDKEGVIRAMVRSLLNAKEIVDDEYESIVKKILEREALGSTGIGRGVAVPHTKHPSVDKLVATVAVSKEGVDFTSLDGEKVQILFLLISPPDRPTDHLRALEHIARQLHDDTFRKFLRQAESKAAILTLLDEADENNFSA